MKHDETNETTEIKIGMKESLYDKIPVTLKQLDVFIAVMVVLFIAFLTIGILKGNGII